MKKSIGDADQSKGDYPVPNNTSAMENRRSIQKSRTACELHHKSHYSQSVI